MHSFKQTGIELLIDDRLEQYLVCEVTQDKMIKLDFTKRPSVKWNPKQPLDQSSKQYVEGGNVAKERGLKYKTPKR